MSTLKLEPEEDKKEETQEKPSIPEKKALSIDSIKLFKPTFGLLNTKVDTEIKTKFNVNAPIFMPSIDPVPLLAPKKKKKKKKNKGGEA